MSVMMSKQVALSHHTQLCRTRTDKTVVILMHASIQKRNNLKIMFLRLRPRRIFPTVANLMFFHFYVDLLHQQNRFSVPLLQPPPCDCSWRALPPLLLPPDECAAVQSRALKSVLTASSHPRFCITVDFG